MSTFFHAFEPVIRLANNGGVYFPGNEVLYPRFARLIRFLVHASLVGGAVTLVTLTVGEMFYLFDDEPDEEREQAQGLTKYYMVLGLGTVGSSFVGVIYLQYRARDLGKVFEIWETELNNPPFEEDRKAEIVAMQRFMTKLVRSLVLFLIIPLMLWLARPFVTRKEVVPTAFFRDRNESPQFEITSFFIFICAFFISSVWSAVISLQFLLTYTIAAELNHLRGAMRKIFDIIPAGRDADADVAEVRRLVRVWLVHHQAVLRYSCGVNRVLGPLILIQHLFTMVFAFTTTFTILLGGMRLDRRIDGILYLIFYYYMLYRISSMGDDIQIKSSGLLAGMLGKEWYMYPRDILRNILILQNVIVNRPIRLKASGFMDLSRNSFGEIAKKGYELITFMANLTGRNRISTLN